MALFSQRQGIRAVSKILQFESIDEELRNRLWNVLTKQIWNQWSPPVDFGSKSNAAKEVDFIVERIWENFFKAPIDKMPSFKSYSESVETGHGIIREHFYEGEWWGSYDLIEFIIQNINVHRKNSLVESLNEALQDENSAYRIVADKVVPITDEHEIEAIESAIGIDKQAPREHLIRALELLTDRKQPDFRNSIKESISAVESVCQAISGKPKATLGDGLKEIQKGKGIHKAFEEALFKLYGYTSDAGGIRHALTNDGNHPTYADAKFMLVLASGFVNFLLLKVNELDKSIVL